MVETDDGLTADEKAKVPDTSYKNAKIYLETIKYNADESTTKEETDSKNKSRALLSI